MEDINLQNQNIDFQESEQKERDEFSHVYSQNQNFDKLQESDEIDGNVDNRKNRITQKIEDLLLDNQYNEIILILNQFNDVDVINIQDRKQLTLVHRLTLHMKLKQVKFIVEYAYNYVQANQLKKEFILKWINKQNNEGYTALHYASFKGDINKMKFLISQGANKETININGLNVLHIAAQGDQPISLCYFDIIGLDLNLSDQKGGSALHWACYLGCENAVNYLISKTKNQINTADGEGLTPLHLAVISGNARVVKKLLQRGANRLVVDKYNKTPAILAEDNEYTNIQQMLEKTGGFAEFCNIKQPFKVIHKNPRQLIVLFFFFY